jgi:multisubunit Na+/H+ antiporter MnhC subunit
MSEVFRTNVRYTGVTLGYQLGAALAGGTAPFIATALLARFNNAWEPVALYMILTAVISLVAILALRETKEAELDDPAKD